MHGTALVRVVGDTSSSAFHKPSAPSPVARTMARPHALSGLADRASSVRSPHADLESKEFIRPLGCRAGQDRQALGLGLHVLLQIDADGPDIDIMPGRQIAPLPVIYSASQSRRRRAITNGERFGASRPNSAASTAYIEN